MQWVSAMGQPPLWPGVFLRIAGLLCAASLAVACGSAPSAAATGSSGASDGFEALGYLGSAAYRRAALVASLVNPENGYSRLRLQHYSTGRANDWDALPEWNPVVEPVSASELAAPAPAGPPADAAALALPGAVASEDDPALVALGRAAFARYPTQLAPYLDVSISDEEAAARVGLWVDRARGVGGLVRARMADGSRILAMTCSTCHAAPGATGIEDGLPNARLDLGAALLAAGGGPPVGKTATATVLAAWGAGRLDVTTAAGTEPVRIPDLRPVRWLSHLHHDATVVARDRATLAIRIETLVVTSYGQVLRPPRVVALALAAYLASLAGGLQGEETAAQASPQGAQIFAARCGSCHAGPGLTGPPVPLAAVGTDPTLGLSADRGTGTYRVPSLRGVGSRGPLLHDGTVPTLAAMFDPARLGLAFSERLHGPGAVPGHPFGLDLPAEQRAALVTYLQGL
jgi:cytochrome c5